MNSGEMIAKAVAAGRSALNEFEAKQLLADFGVPVVRERIVSTAGEAVTAAETLGFPVVLKGIGERILHKTEMGLVHVNLTAPGEIRQAAERVAAAAGSDLEGFLVQPHMAGRREFVAGLFRDAQFGPVIMFGVGGVFTEAFSDTVFRLAPLTEADVDAMLSEIRATALLGPFRGEAAVERKTLANTLLGLSRLAMAHPEISEIDINPLLATPGGELVAVDALLVIAAAQAHAPRPLPPPVAVRDIGALFHPRSIAFVGASAQMGKWGHMLLSNTISGGFTGPIYLVNYKGGTIAGRRVYPSVAQIPDPVDLAVITVPAEHVQPLIPDLARKGIRNAVLITSGFGETGAGGKRLEQALVAAAREAGILVLGPNTMGICNPHIHLYATGSPVQPRAGSTAMVAQSGNMGTQLLAFAETQGIGIRAFAGSGNEAMITIEDYLECFEVDDLTRIVMLYVESVKNGSRFFETARRVGRKKPIILLKGGQSREGNRAAASHTGAMTSDSRIFNAVCRQAGIVKVEHPMDLLDLTAAFSSVPLPRGNRVAIMTLGGGWGVVTADLCAAHGLRIPALTDALLARLDETLPPYWSRSNPVDIVGERDLSLPLKIMEALLAWDGCDALINLGIMGRRIFAERMAATARKTDPDATDDLVDGVRQIMLEFETGYAADIVRLMETYQKPVLGVSLLKDEKDQTVYRVSGASYKAVFYETPERAVRALARMVEYRDFVSRHGGR